MLVKVLKSVGKWIREYNAKNDPEHVYLSQAVDIVDLERRMMALRTGQVRSSALYVTRGF